MQFTNTLRSVIEALRAVQEPDEAIWLPDATLAIADLYPASALAFALFQEGVWAASRRRELRKTVRGGAPLNRTGFDLYGLVSSAEALAMAEGTLIVRELHVAQAFHKDLANQLAELGINSAALVDATDARETPPSPISTPKRAAPVGSARASVLDDMLEQLSVEEIVERDERSALVERKRSILNTEGAALADHEQAAVALVNGNRERVVFLIFGQDDDMTIRGEVDHRGKPLDDSVVRKCQNRLADRLLACTPPIPLRWRKVERGGNVLWVACILGRAKGTAVMTTIGAYPYRTGEHTRYASPELIVAWLRERDDDEFRADPDTSSPSDEPAGGGPSGGAPPTKPDENRRQRGAEHQLASAMDEFFAQPPVIPTTVTGRTVSDWEPVFGPIVAHFDEAIDFAVNVGRTLPQESLSRLMRGVRDVFDVNRKPRDGFSWIIEAPRMIARLIADRLLVYSYSMAEYARIETIAAPMFNSWVGRIPWVLSPEYRHLESLGRDARLAGDVSFYLMSLHETDFVLVGIDTERARRAYVSVSVGLALAAMGREQESAHRIPFAWGLGYPEMWEELRTWEEEPALLSSLAALAGESADTFRRNIAPRLSTLIHTEQASGRSVLVTPERWAAIQRMSEV